MKTNYTLIGDVREKLKELPDKSIQMCVTSPPYYALRDYGTAEWEGGDPNCNHKIGRDTRGGLSNIQKGSKGSFGDEVIKNNQKCPKCNAKRKDNQLGLEDTPEEFVENMVEVFAEVHRVLRDDGTLWLNLGDSYAGNNSRASQGGRAGYGTKREGVFQVGKSYKPKSLMGIPWKVAIALQEWGWILRQDIIWAKKNCMPESVKDRFTKSHEYIFLLSKQPKYFFNQVLEESVSEIKKRTRKKGEGQDSKIGTKGSAGNSGKRNKRSVWNMRTASYKEAHFAVFPPELAETCIKAGCPEKICSECETPYIKVMERKKSIHSDKSESARFSVNLKNNHRKLGEKYSKQMKENPLIDKGLQKQCDCETNETKSGIVLDCFMGSGTTAMVAQDLFRKWIGVELNPEYEKLIRKRTAQQVLF